MKASDIGVMEDEAAPPRPLPLCRLQDQIEKIVAGAEAGEHRLGAAMDDRQAEHYVKADARRMSCVARVTALMPCNMAPLPKRNRRDGRA